MMCARFRGMVRTLGLVCLLMGSCAAQQSVEGAVRDSSGSAVAGARVTLQTQDKKITQDTDSAGKFMFADVAADRGTLTVSAPGFASQSQDWQAGRTADVVLRVRAAGEQVTVSATRVEARVDQTPTTVVVLGEQELRADASPTLDGALRQVPGFSLFRRTDSRTANPTSQGVSLRGVGASGSSRALVLEDGVPLNDPFGGWVYWSRIPKVAVQRVEVGEGGLSDLYGGDAVGGVVNVLTLQPRESYLTVQTDGGNQATGDGSALGSLRIGKWVGIAGVEAFRSDGYIPVEPAARGAVDNQAGSRHQEGSVEIERILTHGSAWVRGELFGEDRNNGTIVEVNDTTIRQLSAGAQWESSGAGSLLFSAYGGTQNYHQTFAPIAADRNSESLTRVQHVPANQAGASAQWSRAVGQANTLVAGVDYRQVQGFSDDVLFAAGVPSSWVDAGGVQRTIGVFGEDLVRAGKWTLVLAAREDHWSNVDALNRAGSFKTPGQETDTALADRTETAFSPRVSAMRQIGGGVAVTASAYRSFRPPTLNELYRTFRLGSVVTQANANLLAERMTGGEAGLMIAPFGRRVAVRPTFFWESVARPVTNLTLSTTPALITRQRQNLGRTQSRGVEIEAEAQLTSHLFAGGGYQFAQATVEESPVDATLIGLWIPQVPRHAATMSVRAADIGGFTLAAQGRYTGLQFDDDRNQFALGSYFLLNVYAARRLAGRVDAFVAIENVLNESYAIGRTPVRTLGSPVLAQVGVRLTLAERRRK